MKKIPGDYSYFSDMYADSYFSNFLVDQINTELKEIRESIRQNIDDILSSFNIDTDVKTAIIKRDW